MLIRNAIIPDSIHSNDLCNDKNNKKYQKKIKQLQEEKQRKSEKAKQKSKPQNSTTSSTSSITRQLPSSASSLLTWFVCRAVKCLSVCLSPSCLLREASKVTYIPFPPGSPDIPVVTAAGSPRNLTTLFSHLSFHMSRDS